MFVRTSRRGQKKRPAKGARKPGSKQEINQPKKPLDQRHLDLIGLGCVLLGIYLVFVLYFGWDGGRLGSGIRDGLKYMIGLAAYAIPLALFAVGAILIFRPSMPTTRPLRTGAVFLLSGLLLAFAGGTLNMGGGRPDSINYFDPGWFPEHGGVFGEAGYWLSATALQPFGAHLIAVFALLAGLLLLTGTTVAAILSRSGSAIKKAGATSAEATRVLKRNPGPAEEPTAIETADSGDFTEPLGEPIVFEPQTGEIEGQTAEIELPTEADASKSPIEVDIWAEEGD
ncbi:MAG: DNA translocase FtsK 4TM domain-containing protein, partial [Actinomycetota bacterium]|nr:DNA translocase FtsK 4TM domain-containing protein [Actinomycetota bacterium]